MAAVVDRPEAAVSAADKSEETATANKYLGKAYYALSVVTVLNVVNLWHRYLLYGLSAVSVEHCEDECDGVPFIPLCDLDEVTSSSSSEQACLSCRRSYNTAFYNLKDGACIDNSQYGVLAGVGFTLTFALATLFAGRLTDVFDKRLLHTGATLVWSMAAAAHGTCDSFQCLLIARIFVGIGQAFHAPACYALIASYFPDSRRATANGLYCAGNYLGAAISSLCLAIAGIVGWRETAYLSGVCGVVMAAVLFFSVDHNPVLPAALANPGKRINHDPALSDFRKPTSTTDIIKLAIAKVSPRQSRPRRYVTTRPTGLPPTPTISSSRPRNQATGNLATEASLLISGEILELSPSLSALKNARKNSMTMSPIIVSRDTKPGADTRKNSSTTSPVIVPRDAKPVVGGRGLDGGGGGWMLPRPHSTTTGCVEGGSLWEGINPFAAASPAGLRRTWSCNSPCGSDHVVTGRKKTGTDGRWYHAEMALCSPASLEDSESFRLDNHSDDDTREEDDDDDDDDDEGEQEEKSGKESRKHQTKQRKSTTDGRENIAKRMLSRWRDTRHDKTNSITTTANNNNNQSFKDIDAAARPTQARESSGTRGMLTSTDDESNKISLAGKTNYGSMEDGNQAPGVNTQLKQYRGGGKDDSGWGGRGGRKHWGGTGRNGEGGTGLWNAIDTIKHSRATVLLYAATSARMVATWTLASYLSTYFGRAFPSQTWLYSICNAVFICAGGMASSYAGGIISDRLRVQSEGYLGYVPAFGAAAAIPPVAVALFSMNFSYSMAGLLLTYLIGECWPGPVMAVIQREVPKEITGTSVAILLFLNSIACNVGPWFVAWRDTGMDSIRGPMFIIICASYLVSSVLFCLVGLSVTGATKPNKIRTPPNLSRKPRQDGDGGGSISSATFFALSPLSALSVLPWNRSKGSTRKNCKKGILSALIMMEEDERQQQASEVENTPDSNACLLSASVLDIDPENLLENGEGQSADVPNQHIWAGTTNERISHIFPPECKAVHGG